MIVLFAAVASWLLISDQGWLSYRALPEEMFEEAQHELLRTGELCRDETCRDVPLEWRDRMSGTVFTRSQFAEHRQTEAWRLASNWFLLGGVLSLVAAWYRRFRSQISFFRQLPAFFAIDAFAAFVVAMLIAS